jgi:two-component system response regulator HydG
MPSAHASSALELLNLLVVDDERAVREGCRDVARSMGLPTFTAENAEQALRILSENGADVVLLDLHLPGRDGLETMREIRRRYPECQIIVVTGYASVRSAVEAMKLGAYDYVTKPFNVEELRLLLERVAERVKIERENRVLREQLRSAQGFAGLVGRAPEMEKLYRIIAKAASSVHPVLIVGESGTGKELVARAVHSSGPRAAQPFMPVDCGSLVPTLIESELFGYTKGAFTGAARSKDGLLVAAQGGTVFFDEIGELPLDLQAKLLRALQEKEIRPVGSTRSLPIDVRVLAATNRDLGAAVQAGTFRKDLYFRLNVLTLRLPPLRERKQDIPLLVTHFLEVIGQASGLERNLSDEALRMMLAYDWPGNVRELENCLERACAISSGPVLHVLDLPTTLQNAQTPGSENAAAGPSIVPMAELERRAILQALEQVHGDKLLAARLLGIGKTTLYRKLKEYASDHRN